MSQSKAVTRTLTIGTTAVVLASPSQNRISLLVGQPNGGRITLSADSSIADQNGLVINPGDLPLQLKTCDHGCFVQGIIYAIALNAGTIVTVVEVIQS